ncbi:MAG: CehA/McbA family metallohydrolase [Cytophagales bacterium]|nr:CehA/McbA family metallohydrolase [Cytophagales bacterium]
MKYFLIALLFFTACTRKEKSASDAYRWYKGNTHTHTVLCGHADTHPDTVAQWYLDRDYNFLILSEHNMFIDPEEVKLPENRRKDFILIPGEEVSDYAHIHTTAMNIRRVVPTQYPDELSTVKNNPFDNFKVYLMQKHTDSIRSAGGIPILNHPNWQSGASASDIGQVERLHMIELYNGHPDVNNWGTATHASMEQKWDSLLTAGRKIYGVSSDDAHFFQEWAADVSNPGRGWVMVKSKELSPEAITGAMASGDFYSSSGVMLSRVETDQEKYTVTADTSATYEAIESPFVLGYKSRERNDGFFVEFISDHGQVLKKMNGPSASFEVPEGKTYVRAKVTYSRTRGSGSQQFFAWTQPVFIH